MDVNEESVGLIAAAAVSVTVTVATVVSALVPDEKMPKWLSAILNVLAGNVGKSKNAQGQ
jgi:hypothetical protein